MERRSQLDSPASPMAEPNLVDQELYRQLAKGRDPRFGETTYQLTGIQRAEPDHWLFEIPPGYAVKSMPAPMGFPAGPAEGDPVPIGIVRTMGPIGK